MSKKSENICQSQSEIPIKISFEKLETETLTSISAERRYYVTLNVEIRISERLVQKFVDKNLSIEDLNELIDSRL